jgi:hypothetical protein
MFEALPTSVLVAGLAVVSASLVLLKVRPRNQLNHIPRIGPAPGLLGNTSSGYFSGHSLELIKEGYAKVCLLGLP